MTTIDSLNSEVEFDVPFMVDEGNVIRVVGVYAPEVYHDETDDIEIVSDEWEAMTGYTGQHGYNGAVMHPSETLSGGLAYDILNESHGDIYVVVAVLDYDNPEALVGWAVLRYTGPAGPCCADPACTNGECLK